MASASSASGGAVRKLSAEAISSIRSTVNIPGIPQIVEELVANSIDAGARRVAVRFDMDQLWLEVADNGTGIGAEDLALVGARYCTSKHRAPGGKPGGQSGSADADADAAAAAAALATYGFRGEALASVRNIGRVRITTRCGGGGLTRTRTMPLASMGAESGGAAPGQGGVLPAASQRPQPGTTVEVSRIFETLPVRRLGISATQYEAIRLRVQCFALAHPRVAFSLHNRASNRTLVDTPACISAREVFENLFGPDKAGDLVPVDFRAGAFRVVGFTSQGRHHNRALQFMFVHRCTLFHTLWHDAVGGVFAAAAELAAAPGQQGQESPWREGWSTCACWTRSARRRRTAFAPTRPRRPSSHTTGRQHFSALVQPSGAASRAPRPTARGAPAPPAAAAAATAAAGHRAPPRRCRGPHSAGAAAHPRRASPCGTRARGGTLRRPPRPTSRS